MIKLCFSSAFPGFHSFIAFFIFVLSVYDAQQEICSVLKCERNSDFSLEAVSVMHLHDCHLFFHVRMFNSISLSL